MEALPGEKLIFYSIGFVNDPALMDQYELYEPNLSQFLSINFSIFAQTMVSNREVNHNKKGLKTLKEKTVENVMEFLAMELEDQRKLLASKEKAKRKQVETYIRGICDIIRNIVSDTKLVKYFILLLDGMIEGTVSVVTITHSPQMIATDCQS